MPDIIRLVAVAATAFTLSLAASAASACTKARVPGADRVISLQQGINQNLLNQAMLAEINYHRCRAGLNRLQPSRAFTQMAAVHSDWMARHRQLTHRSNIRGMSSLRDRIDRSGVKVSRAAENLGVAHRMAFQPGVQFFTTDASTCQFRDSRRPQIPPHTYASIAKLMVDMWMKSPGHRQNIMTRGISMHGAAIAIDTRAEFCGKIYATQKFGG